MGQRKKSSSYGLLRADVCRGGVVLCSASTLSSVESAKRTLDRPRHQPLKPTSHCAPGLGPRQERPLDGGAQPMGKRILSRVVELTRSHEGLIPDWESHPRCMGSNCCSSQSCTLHSAIQSFPGQYLCCMPDCRSSDWVGKSCRIAWHGGQHTGGVRLHWGWGGDGSVTRWYTEDVRTPRMTRRSTLRLHPRKRR